MIDNISRRKSTKYNTKVKFSRKQTVPCQETVNYFAQTTRYVNEFLLMWK